MIDKLNTSTATAVINRSPEKPRKTERQISAVKGQTSLDRFYKTPASEPAFDFREINRLLPGSVSPQTLIKPRARTLAVNQDELPIIKVGGLATNPTVKAPYTIDNNGEAHTFNRVGGITLNFGVGDGVRSKNADHLEPGVSVKNPKEQEDGALNTFSCIGNSAQVISGDAKGSRGVVIGKHGGIEHVLVQFDRDTMEKMNPGDGIVVRSQGTGMKLTDFPDITVMNADPQLLEKMGIQINGDALEVPVTHLVPGKIMGSGRGAATTSRGDYDIELFDEKTVQEYGLEDLRIGDIVAVMDQDNRYGRGYLTGAVSIGVVMHSDCVINGHGPGFTTLLTTPKAGLIKPVISKKANLKDILNIQR